MRYQQIYAATAFPQGGVIDKLVFRRDDSVRPGVVGDVDLQVAFAYASTAVATASAVFADNIGDEFTTVLDGVATVSTDGLVLDVADLFNYDSARGDLLVQIIQRDFNHFADFDASLAPEQNVTTRIWANGANSTTGHVGLGFGDTRHFGLVTLFQFVPEPSTIAQFSVMLLLVSARRRNRSRDER